MPNPVTQDQTVSAINKALKQLQPPGNAIDNLDTNAISDSKWSCYNFGPGVVEEICEMTKQNLNTQKYRYEQRANLPAGFADKTFVNISMTGDRSELNHNFNILVLDGMTYLIQVYVNRNVNIVRRFANGDFIRHWHNLSNNINWVDSYSALFGVAPNDVAPNPPINTWWTEQYVSQ